MRLRTFGSEIGASAEYTDHDPTGTGLGCLFAIISLFRNNEVARKEIIIEKLSIIEKVTSRVYIKVNQFESTLLQEFAD